MGEFPVISISFKRIYGSSYTDAIAAMLDTIANLYRKFMFLEDSSQIYISDRQAFGQYFDFCNNVSKDLTQKNNLSIAKRIAISFLPRLADMLYQEYGRKVLIIIDEYDVPLQKSYVAKEPYYDQMLEIIRGISGAIFKKDSKPWLLKCIVTWRLKIAHQSIVTDANNFATYCMDTNKYAGFFGFTRSETKKLLQDYELSHQLDIVKKWYDGYRMGNEHLFCPWSVLNFISYAIDNMDNIIPGTFWVNTSGNDAIELYLKRTINSNLRGEIKCMEELLKGVDQEISLQEFDTYPDIMDKGASFESLMTLFLKTGYLTFTDDTGFQNPTHLKIPNSEVRKCFEIKLKKLYSKSNPVWLEYGKKLLSHLMVNEYEEASSILKKLLDRFISVRETGYEFFYHGFVHGILTMAIDEEDIDVESDTETGDGFADIILSNSTLKVAVILEFKKCENNYEARVSAANSATKQIIERRYAQKLINENYKTIYGLGLGCGGKSCVIKSLGNLAT